MISSNTKCLAGGYLEFILITELFMVPALLHEPDGTARPGVEAGGYIPVNQPVRVLLPDK